MQIHLVWVQKSIDGFIIEMPVATISKIRFNIYLRIREGQNLNVPGLIQGLVVIGGHN